MKTRSAWLGLIMALMTGGRVSAQGVMTVEQLLALPQPKADVRVPYGPAPQQFADLRLPRGGGPFPVVIFVHGGCWQSAYSLNHAASLCAAFAREGYATWSVEYRRLGDEGGGWPGTFEDVARAADALRKAAESYPLDLRRVVAMGHSAGGQLALWLAARPRLAQGSPLYVKSPLALRGAISLAGVVDLEAGAAAGVCGDAIPSLLGAEGDARRARLREVSPRSLLPLGVPQRLVVGSEDSVVPVELARDFQTAALAAGDPVRLDVVMGCGHYELVDPGSAAWPTVVAAVRDLLGPAAEGERPRRKLTRRP